MLVEAYAETYDLDYGRHLVAMPEEERVDKGSLFAHRAKEFRDYDIGKFGLNLLQYIGLPRPFIEELKLAAEAAMKSDVDLSGDIKRRVTGK